MVNCGKTNYQPSQLVDIEPVPWNGSCLSIFLGRTPLKLLNYAQVTQAPNFLKSLKFLKLRKCNYQFSPEHPKWRFPKIGIPPRHHPFKLGFPSYRYWGIPTMEPPHVSRCAHIFPYVSQTFPLHSIWDFPVIFPNKANPMITLLLIVDLPL